MIRKKIRLVFDELSNSYFDICSLISFRTISCFKKTSKKDFLFAILVSIFCLSAKAQAAGKQLLHGHVPPVIHTSTLVGPVQADQQIDLAIGLPLRNQEALDNLLKSLYDPKSSNYRKFLTPEKFA
jgi:hypothetical protein